jgi:A118 family predicted phage portal protein
VPLPTDPTLVWPPPELGDAIRAYTKWAAWWSGDTEQLARVYATSVGFADPIVDARDRRGLVQLLPRFFHGAPAARGALKSAKLHIPLAADIATTSADLLFGEAPALVAAEDGDTKRPESTATASPTQQRLDEFMENGLQAVLLEAAEIAAAFGGVYVRIGWDTSIADLPLFDAIAPDAAVPEFRSGQLTAVTFYKTLSAQGDGKTWRHLERHEPGRILHGLYCSGDDKTLGQKMPLTAHPETAPFATLPGGGENIATGADGLCAEYVPNMRPNRRLRGSQLGRSDFDGVETVMDALDEAWTSWMRDLRLGKGRIMVPEAYLDSAGRGQGALFDTEQEVFQQLNALPGAGQGGLQLTNVQFDIRVVEHQQTCQSLTEEAVRGAGYSAQTFGMSGEAAATATEVVARERRSYTTRSKKMNYFKPALRRLARTALQVDVAQFKTKGILPVLPDVEFPDGVAVDPQAQATTLQLLKAAQAVSIKTAVEMLHPDWDDTRVASEVKLIEAEGAPPAAAMPAFPGTAATDSASDGSGGGDGPGAGTPGPAVAGTTGGPGSTTASGTGAAPAGQQRPAAAGPAARRPPVTVGRRGARF